MSQPKSNKSLSTSSGAGSLTQAVYECGTSTPLDDMGVTLTLMLTFGIMIGPSQIGFRVICSDSRNTEDEGMRRASGVRERFVGRLGVSASYGEWRRRQGRRKRRRVERDAT
jgi:hypothetical protein